MMTMMVMMERIPVVSPPVCPRLGVVSSAPIWPPRTGVGALSPFLAGDSRV